MATPWAEDEEDETTNSPWDWDLEDALARAILDDVEGFPTASKSSADASTATLRDDAEEERLIEQLHARLLPSKDLVVATKPRQTTQRPRPAKPSSVRHPKFVTTPAPVQPRRSISPEKIDQMVDRFRLHEAKRSRKLMMLKHQTTASSVTSSASSDLLSPRSRELTRDLPGFQQRQAIAMANRERELQRQRLQAKQQECRMGGSLLEAVRTPCICGSASGSRVLRDAHSPACTRFMDACEKMNATSEIQRKKQHMRRTVDNMMRFHVDSKRKQAEMAEIQRMREQQEATFAPQLNRNSIKIYEEMVARGRLEERRSGRNAASPSPPRQPALGAKSKLVFSHPRRRSSITSRGSVKPKASIFTGRRRPSHSLIPKAASFSESHWAKRTAAPAHTDTPPAAPQPPPFLVPWTTVPFTNVTCEFILANFDQPAWFH